MIRCFRHIAFVVLMLVGCVCAFAQVQVVAEIDPIEILIGEQTNVTLKVTMKEGQALQMPEFQSSQYITPGVEVLEMSNADTTKLDNGMVQVSRVYTMTSFDENLYYVPAMKVNVNGKEYKAKNLALKVLTVPVDTTQVDKFYPPKDVQDNPFQWGEWSPLFWLSVLMLLLICLGGYLYIRLKDNKPIIAGVRIIKRILPHQKAMMEIEKIKASKMTLSEDQKEYYTRLTDTLRKYIEERFGFNAMEMTSSEIIARLQDTGDRKMVDELRELFMTADLVKFAKYSTLINENDANLVNAISFINETKLENMPEQERIEPKLTEQQKRSVRSRIILKSVIWTIAVVCVALLCYVLYQIYMLV